MRLVLDASAAVRVVMRAEDAAGLLAVLAGADVVAAPRLFASEVANSLWKYTRAGALAVETALGRYEEAMGLVDDLTPDDELATEALAEAAHHGHPVYDLLYAILARRHGCSVLTRDERLANLLGVMGIPVA
jgi:predicted nucleic acid-binding protein